MFWALFALEPVRWLGVGAYNVYEKVKSIKDRKRKAAAEAERIRREQEEEEAELAAKNRVDMQIEEKIHGAKLAPYAKVDPNTKKSSPRSYTSGDFPPPLSSPSTKPPSYKTAMAPSPPKERAPQPPREEEPQGGEDEASLH